MLTRVPDELHARLVAQAEREGRSITSLVVAVLSAALDGDHLDRRGRLRAKASQLGLRASASDLGEPASRDANGLTSAHGVGPFIDGFLDEDRGWDRYTSEGLTPRAGDVAAPAASGGAPARPAEPDDPRR